MNAKVTTRQRVKKVKEKSEQCELKEEDSCSQRELNSNMTPFDPS